MAAILAYHSQNVGGDRSAVNDHEALAADLEALTRAGWTIRPLAELLDALYGNGRAGAGGTAGPAPAETDAAALERTVCLTFDDGCDFDVRDIEFPGVGTQRSFLGTLEDFAANADGDVEPHATIFVIASDAARRTIDEKSLFGHGWMSDDWWFEAERHPMLSVGNHGWDHNHPDLDPEDPGRGGFMSIDSSRPCELQVVRAAERIASRTGVWPDVFAYPFGESSAYIRETWFPAAAERHRCRAAVGTDPGFVTPDTDRWNLPRFVCGRDWKTSEELLTRLGTS